MTTSGRAAYPATLARDGLAAALAAVADRAPLPVVYDAAADCESLPEPISLTAYYVAR